MEREEEHPQRRFLTYYFALFALDREQTDITSISFSKVVLYSYLYKSFFYKSSLNNDWFLAT